MSSEYPQGLSSRPCPLCLSHSRLWASRSPEQSPRSHPPGAPLAQPFPLLLLPVLPNLCFDLWPQERKLSGLAKEGFLPDPPDGFGEDTEMILIIE